MSFALVKLVLCLCIIALNTLINSYSDFFNSSWRQHLVKTITLAATAMGSPLLKNIYYIWIIFIFHSFSFLDDVNWFRSIISVLLLLSMLISMINSSIKEQPPNVKKTNRFFSEGDSMTFPASFLLFICPFEKRTYYAMTMSVRLSVRPSVRPSFPDFFSTCFEISIWNLVYAFSRWHDMSSLSFITIGSLRPSLQPKVGQTQFLQSWPYKSR